MEFKLNKIDVEIRQRVNEKTKEGKVHSKENINVSKAISGKSENNSEEFHEQLNKMKKKDKKITVEAVMSENLEVDAFKDNYAIEFDKGRFLDTKK